MSVRSDPAHAALRRFWLYPALAFLLAASLSGALVGESERHRRETVRALVSDAAADHAKALERHLERALSAAYSLAALVRHGQGDIADFEQVAAQVRSYHPGVAALQLAPGGVIRRIHPLAGNEPALGHDLLHDPQRNKEAILARDSNQLTLAGPFPLTQGGLGAAGRLPVFLDDERSGRTFWGFTTVLLRFPQTLEAANLPDPATRGHAYELWRMNPDTGKKQVIASSVPERITSPIERPVLVANTAWTVSMAPLDGWGDPLGLAGKSLLALLVSLLVAYLTRLMFMLHAHGRTLEAQVTQRTAELAAREADLERAQSVAQVGSWTIDHGADGSRCTLSTEARRILGLDAGATLGCDAFLSKVHALDREAVARAWQNALAGARVGVECRIEVRGELRWVRVKAETALQGDGQQRLVGTLQDISDRKQADHALRVAATAFETTEGIVITDAHRTIQQVNRAFTRITGYRTEEALGKNTRFLQSGRQDHAFYAAMHDAIARAGAWAGEVWNRRSNGQLYPAWLTVTAVKGDGGQVTNYVGTLVDITQRKAAEEEVARLAYFDPLTQLPNRRLLMDRLQHALAKRARSGDCGALLFLDLDRFKQLNDSHGHERGDELLRQVGSRLLDTVRECDTVARMGGDEFVALLEGLSPIRRAAEAQARGVAKKILERLDAPYDLGGLPYRITASIGLALFDSSPVTMVELLRQADAAMYAAKATQRAPQASRGRALVVLDPPTARAGADETRW